MKRTLFIVAVLVAFATGASAATLSIVSDKTTYNVGETITLSVNGDAQGASAQGIYGRILFDGSLVDVNTATQKLIGGGWTKGGLVTSDTGAPGSNQTAFDQVNFSGGFQTAANPIATITLIAQAAGVVGIQWDTTTPTFELGYFGLTNAAGTSFTINGVVPEPTTAGLLGLGLLGLALGGRRRS